MYGRPFNGFVGRGTMIDICPVCGCRDLNTSGSYCLRCGYCESNERIVVEEQDNSGTAKEMDLTLYPELGTIHGRLYD